MQLSIVTDEISQDLEHALQVCRDLGVDTVELRTFDNKNIVFHDDASLKRVQDLLENGGFKVCSIASPFLKSPFWQNESEQEREWEILQHSFELAKRFNAPLVRTFSFMRVPDPTAVREKVLEVIAEAVRRTEEAGLKLVIENEHACNIATGEETGWLLERIPSTSFGVIWDPGNEAALGSSPFPEGYAHVRQRAYHVHLKDVDDQFRWTGMGAGTIDYVSQFRALAADGYEGYMSLETHYSHPQGGQEQATRESFASLLTLLREAGVS
ncbi:sugar phosphate isomerase/epimerase family protein [Ktedonospora formicarum]|uniref:Xylose isomerase-like TIM barrel domain-containing protein n=1 Tax=Ktedonospora formicarum TaxID=2778364 RepID=A0A8J3I253_9CHLR|nr:sugar phosphate isomerase/epimerase family protein [Ktedonospora formicarum]GHO46216.1 hypothetical protein KSX_43790 [Ktedonospora formicarum]